jgi:hypothetical protein
MGNLFVLLYFFYIGIQSYLFVSYSNQLTISLHVSSLRQFMIYLYVIKIIHLYEL